MTRTALIYAAARRRAHQRDLRILRGYFDMVSEEEDGGPQSSNADHSAWASVGRWRGGPEGGAGWVKLAARAHEPHRPGRAAYGFEGMTLAEVAEHFKCSPERVRQIEMKALRKLRQATARPNSLLPGAEEVAALREFVR